MYDHWALYHPAIMSMIITVQIIVKRYIVVDSNVWHIDLFRFLWLYCNGVACRLVIKSLVSLLLWLLLYDDEIVEVVVFKGDIGGSVLIVYIGVEEGNVDVDIAVDEGILLLLLLLYCCWFKCLAHWYCWYCIEANACWWICCFKGSIGGCVWYDDDVILLVSIGMIVFVVVEVVVV